MSHREVGRSACVLLGGQRHRSQCPFPPGPVAGRVMSPEDVPGPILEYVTLTDRKDFGIKLGDPEMGRDHGLIIWVGLVPSGILTRGRQQGRVPQQ